MKFKELINKSNKKETPLFNLTKREQKAILIRALKEANHLQENLLREYKNKLSE